MFICDCVYLTINYVILRYIFFIHFTTTFSRSDSSFLDIRGTLQRYVDSGQYREVLKVLNKVEDEYGTLVVDGYLPTLYLYKGVAYHGLHLLKEAENAFTESVLYYPDDTRSWINLGEMQTLLMKFNESVVSFEEAYIRGDVMALTRLMSAKGWVDSWRNFELISAEVEKDALRCSSGNENITCSTESAFGLEYTDVPGEVIKYFHKRSPYSWESNFLVHPQARSTLWRDLTEINQFRRLKVGVISSDFGVHPVSSLIRGVLQFIDKSKIELFCFSVTDDLGWWGVNVSQSVEHFHILSGINTQTGATIIASKKIDILIDLNGHTKNSGLAYLSHRPAPVQMSFLGLPTTTGSIFIDYFIGDYVALPPEISTHFTEKLLLLQPCYIANDYAQLQGDVVEHFSGYSRANRTALTTDYDVIKATILFGTISNSQKIDSIIFHVWMNILRIFRGSKMTLTQHAGLNMAIPNLRQYCQINGISKDRLVMSDLAPWLDHLWQKTSIDIILDTSVKNGHTTGLDGLWSGIPSVTLGNGASMPSRAGESIASALGSSFGVSYSLKDYETLVSQFAYNTSESFVNIDYQNIKQSLISLLLSVKSFRQSRYYKRLLNANSKRNLRQYDEDMTKIVNDLVYYDKINNSGLKKLRIWRDYVQSLRTTSGLFNTRKWTNEFTYLLQASWDATILASSRQNIHQSNNNTDSTQTNEHSQVDTRRKNNNTNKHFYGGLSVKIKSSKDKRPTQETISDVFVKTDDDQVRIVEKTDYFTENKAEDASKFKIYHVFSITRPQHNQEEEIPLEQAYDENSKIFFKTLPKSNRKQLRYRLVYDGVSDSNSVVNMTANQVLLTSLNDNDELKTENESQRMTDLNETVYNASASVDNSEVINDATKDKYDRLLSETILNRSSNLFSVKNSRTTVKSSGIGSQNDRNNVSNFDSDLPSDLFTSNDLIFLNIGELMLSIHSL